MQFLICLLAYDLAFFGLADRGVSKFQMSRHVLSANDVAMDLHRGALLPEGSNMRNLSVNGYAQFPFGKLDSLLIGGIYPNGDLSRNVRQKGKAGEYAFGRPWQKAHKLQAASRITGQVALVNKIKGDLQDCWAVRNRRGPFENANLPILYGSPWHHGRLLEPSLPLHDVGLASHDLGLGLNAPEGSRRSGNTSLHGNGYLLHGGSCAGCLCNGCLHIVSLATRDLIHFFNRVLQPSSLQAKDYRLNDTDKSQDAGQFHQRPIGIRLILFFSLFLGGFVWSFYWWQNFDSERRVFSAAQIIFGHALSCFGVLTWLSW